MFNPAHNNIIKTIIIEFPRYIKKGLIAMRKKILSRGLKFGVIAFLVIPLANASALDVGKIKGHVKSLKPKISAELVPVIEEQAAKRLFFPQIAGLFTANRTTVVLEFTEGSAINRARLAGYGCRVKKIQDRKSVV